jgi:hypothetical protein
MAKMSQQDKRDFRTPLMELKALWDSLEAIDVGSVGRHGNSTLNLTKVIALALLTFGWNQQRTFGNRFADAHAAISRSFSPTALAGSFQTLMVVLRSCGDTTGG